MPVRPGGFVLSSKKNNRPPNHVMHVYLCTQTKTLTEPVTLCDTNLHGQCQVQYSTAKLLKMTPADVITQAAQNIVTHNLLHYVMLH